MPFLRLKTFKIYYYIHKISILLKYLIPCYHVTIDIFTYLSYKNLGAEPEVCQLLRWAYI